ncbi:hypothetical protein B0T16DRAFT_392560 [Cercophora newfieldiana]|uniref:Uncharacterized protein n=1 Tax=Cercophora newfieldiana TaxID=92897 RepID=A0AA39Y1A4_9PEZI|nr:hypothetical protein B0T16DRAFT_392560 [Cercophora newfieldiana]
MFSLILYITTLFGTLTIATLISHNSPMDVSKDASIPVGIPINPSTHATTNPFTVSDLLPKRALVSRCTPNITKYDDEEEEGKCCDIFCAVCSDDHSCKEQTDCYHAGVEGEVEVDGSKERL